MRRKQMFLDYVKFWFWVDLISSIPFTWFLEGFENTNLTGGTSRAPKLIKLMKISKILKMSLVMIFKDLLILIMLKNLWLSGSKRRRPSNLYKEFSINF